MQKSYVEEKKVHSDENSFIKGVVPARRRPLFSDFGNSKNTPFAVKCSEEKTRVFSCHPMVLAQKLSFWSSRGPDFPKQNDQK